VVQGHADPVDSVVPWPVRRIRVVGNGDCAVAVRVQSYGVGATR